MQFALIGQRKLTLHEHAPEESHTPAEPKSQIQDVLSLAGCLRRGAERGDLVDDDPATRGQRAEIIWLGQSYRPEPDAKVFAAYAGSQTCRACHAEAFALWSTSHHALAERAVDLSRDRAAFEPARSVKHGSQISEARVTDGRFELMTSGEDRERKGFAGVRVIGQATLRQFLLPTTVGRLQVTELAYDPARGNWFDATGRPRVRARSPLPRTADPAK